MTGLDVGSSFILVGGLIVYHIVFVLLGLIFLIDNQDPLVICAISSSLVFIL